MNVNQFDYYLPPELIAQTPLEPRHASRLMVLHAAWRIEREGPRAAREEISLIKFSVAGTLQRVLDRALQTLGETPWWPE